MRLPIPGTNGYEISSESVVDSEFPEVSLSELEELRSRRKPKELWCYNK